MADLDHDLHVLAQDVADRWIAPAERAIAYRAAAEALRMYSKDPRACQPKGEMDGHHG